MKLEELSVLLERQGRQKTENDDMYRTPAPGKIGAYITSAQAAKSLGVTMSRIRQLVMDDRLESHKPEKGRRDHLFKRADVAQLKKEIGSEMGRPVENDDSKKKKKKKVSEGYIAEAKNTTYTLYHKSYTDAINHALDWHEKQGLKVDDDDRWQKISVGSKKPREDETTRIQIPATNHRTGRSHMIMIQVYNKGGATPYELNTYSSIVPRSKVK